MEPLNIASKNVKLSTTVEISLASLQKTKHGFDSAIPFLD